MKVRAEMLNSTGPWTIAPTTLERQVGRLLRGPEGHDDPPAPPAPPASLVTDPPVGDPPAGDPPADPPKPADPPAPVADVVEPIKVEDLVAPEGFEIKPEMAEPLLEILNGDQSPQDRANALIALHTKTLTEASEASSKAWEDMQETWKTEAKNDPDIGGSKLQPTLTNIGKLLDEYGTKEVRGAFDLTGAGNNPHVIKFLGKIAEKLTEGGFNPGGGPRGDLTAEEKAQRMFPSMKG